MNTGLSLVKSDYVILILTLVQSQSTEPKLYLTVGFKRLPLFHKFLALNDWYLFNNKMSMPNVGTSCLPGKVSIVTGHM